MARRFGPYLLQEKIADGGMAEIFLASKEGPDGWKLPVVVKRILPPFADRPDYQQMFAAEAALATTLRHPNLVHVYDYSKIEGSLCIVLEYVAGRDLATVVRKAGPLDWQAVAAIAFEVLKGLEYLHRRAEPIFHRDISPQNILVAYDGLVRLIDFGIASHASLVEADMRFRGKRAYLPPEYFQGQPFTAGGDLYAVGLVMAEALTGEQAEQLRQRGLPALMANLPAEANRVLGKFLSRLLAPLPSDRFADAETARVTLAQLMSGGHFPVHQGAPHLQQLMARFFPLSDDRAHLPLSQTAVLPKGSRSFPLVGRLVGKFGLGVVALVVLVTGWLWWLARPVAEAPPGKLSEPAGLSPIAPPPPAKHPFSKPGDRKGTTVATVENGWLAVGGEPATVYFNGRMLGRTPLHRQAVPAGQHHLFVVADDNQRRWQGTVTVEPGQTLQWKGRLAKP